MTFARLNPAAARNSSGSSARICSGVGVWPSKRSSSLRQIAAAALTESCWPAIDRTSAVEILRAPAGISDGWERTAVVVDERRHDGIRGAQVFVGGDHT